MLKRFVDALLKRPRAGAVTQTRDKHDEALDEARKRAAAGDAAGAARLIDEVLSFPSHRGSFLNSAGVLKLGIRDYAGAQACFERALEASPQLAEAHSNLAIALLEQGLRDPGVHHLQRAIALEPKLLAARENLAALLTSELSPLALHAWDDVLEVDPHHARAHAGKGLLRLREGRVEEARALYGRARALGIDPADIELDEAALDAMQGDFAGARSKAEALRGRAADADIDWQLALAYLAAGNFGDGWPRYEARLRRTFESPRRAYTFPEWDGSRLDRGALLIMGEQGLGDEIMFASCYADALERVRHCIIDCEPRLERLYRRSFPSAEVVGQARGGVHGGIAGDARVACQIHAGSLPRIFRLDVRSFPLHGGYLVADNARIDYWRRRLHRDGAGRCIGIAWSGGLHHTRRQLRSIPVRDLAPLLQVPGAQFVSLQHDDDGREARELGIAAGAVVHAYPDVMQDLDDTAALISALDGVASVCSAVVHLAGALGTPTVVLTPKIAEWRYLAKGASMPWYPAAHLIRQSAGDSWVDVLEAARTALCTLQERKPQPPEA